MNNLLSNRTSYPEHVIFYYVKQFYKDAIHSAKFDFLHKSEVDIYIPSIKIAIEYDGYKYHQDVINDMTKDTLLHANNIKVVRIREQECPEITSSDKIIITDKYKSDMSYLKNALNELMLYIGINNFTCNIQNDYLIIRKDYQNRIEENSLAKMFPDIANEWDYEKNNVLKPIDVPCSAGINVFWKCKNGHSYNALINNRTGVNKTGCPYCANIKVLEGFNDLASCKELIIDWDYTKNEIDPKTIVRNYSKYVWWKCHVCGHEWHQSPNNRIVNKTGCPKCGIEKNKESIHNYYIEHNGSLADRYPDIASQWNYNKNDKSPNEYTAGSHDKVWWICPICNYEYQMVIHNRTGNQKQGCPQCAKINRVNTKRQTILKHGHSVAEYENLVKEWDYQKNDKKPEEVSYGSRIKVWWICSKGHEYEAQVANRVNGRGCPYCANKKTWIEPINEQDLIDGYDF